MRRERGMMEGRKGERERTGEGEGDSEAGTRAS